MQRLSAGSSGCLELVSKHERRRWCAGRQCVCLVILAALTFPARAVASPESHALLQQGARDLAARKYEAALKKFEAAARADITDAEAPFFQGVALNRLGRYYAAWIKLQQARTMGVGHPEYSFELGWSMVGLQRWIEAVTQLESYEKAHPGRGQTSELLGRAYLAMGQYDQAAESYAEAVRRDPGLKPTVGYYQALLEQRRGNKEAARDQIQALLQESPSSPVARAVSSQLATLAILDKPPAPTRADGKPWRFSVSIGGGRNSNVIFLGSGVPLPVDITRKSASFVRATLNGSYTWRMQNNDTLTAGYSFQGESYKGLGRADLRDHYVFGDYAHAFNRKWSGGLRVSDEYTYIGGNSFRNQVVLRPAVALRHSPRAVTELAYSYARSNYMFPTAPVQDRDGTTQAVSVAHYFNPKGTRIRARVGAFYGRNNADGADFDSRSPGLFAGVSYPLGKNTNLDAGYAHTSDRYRNPNSLSTPAFSSRRHDNGDVFSLQLTHRFNRTFSGYVQFNHSRNNSNIPFFDYKQNIIGGGVVAHF